MPSYPDALIADAYRRVQRACAFAGVFGSDAEDVAQEVWLWLVRLEVPSSNIDSPWLEAVTRHFALRRRREAARRGQRERRWSEAVAQARREPDRDRFLDETELLRRMEEALAGKDRRVLALMRLGFSFAEASAVLGIPRGSRERIYLRLVSCGRQQVESSVSIPDGALRSGPALARRG